MRATGLAVPASFASMHTPLGALRHAGRHSKPCRPINGPQNNPDTQGPELACRSFFRHSLGGTCSGSAQGQANQQDGKRKDRKTAPLVTATYGAARKKRRHASVGHPLLTGAAIVPKTALATKKKPPCSVCSCPAVEMLLGSLSLAQVETAPPALATNGTAQTTLKYRSLLAGRGRRS